MTQDTKAALAMKQVTKMVEDMDVIAKFLNRKGRFVGDMVHISIDDLAKCITRSLSQPVAQPDGEVWRGIAQGKDVVIKQLEAEIAALKSPPPVTEQPAPEVVELEKALNKCGNDEEWYPDAKADPIILEAAQNWLHLQRQRGGV